MNLEQIESKIMEVVSEGEMWDLKLNIINSKPVMVFSEGFDKKQVNYFEIKNKNYYLVSYFTDKEILTINISPGSGCYILWKNNKFTSDNCKTWYSIEKNLEILISEYNSLDVNKKSEFMEIVWIIYEPDQSCSEEIKYNHNLLNLFSDSWLTLKTYSVRN